MFLQVVSLFCAIVSSVPLPALQDAAHEHLILPPALLPFPRVLIWPNHLFNLLEDACTLSDISIFFARCLLKRPFKTKISGSILTFCNVQIGNIGCLEFGL